MKALWTSALFDARDNVLQAKSKEAKTTEKNTTDEGDVKEQTRSTINGIVEYTPKEYNDFGWVAVNKVLTGKEFKKLYSQFANIKLNKNYNYKNKLGEYVILVGDKYDSIDHIVYIKGTNKHLVIRQIVGFIETISDEDRKTIAKDVLNDEYGKYFTDAFEIAEAYARKNVSLNIWLPIYHHIAFTEIEQGDKIVAELLSIMENGRTEKEISQIAQEKYKIEMK